MSISADSLRSAVVTLMKSLEGKNKYSQKANYRNRIMSGYGDCSATVQYVYKAAANINPGSYTAAQITSKLGVDVDQATTKRNYALENNLLPGDLLFFKGTDTTRPYTVGHVEMYIGNGKIMGHGSGQGPTIKNMKAYCLKRAASGRGYIKARRFITMDEAEAVSKKLIKRLQIVLNTKGYRDSDKKKVQEDGIANESTLSACPRLTKGKDNPIVAIMQEGLIELGIKVGTAGADGVFGALTIAGVKQFQKANGLKADGIFGKKSWRVWLGLTNKE